MLARTDGMSKKPSNRLLTRAAQNPNRAATVREPVR
jgi:hypothetical protein